MFKRLGLAFAFLLVLIVVFSLGYISAKLKPPGVKVGYIEINGTINNQTSESVSSAIRKAKQDPNIRGILLRVNSPGGSVGASQEIFETLMNYKESTGRPIIVSMGDVAASGGYYVSIAGDKIFALPSTLTGSIGVISNILDIHDLMKKIGVKEETLKTGEYKDTGSIFRSLTPQDKEYLMGLIGDAYGQFLYDVSTRRNIPIDKLRTIADGRVFSGAKAKSLGLIDELGTLNDTIDYMKNLLGAKKITLEKLNNKGILEELMGTSSKTDIEQKNFLIYALSVLKNSLLK
ncbi:signal peptide peptidase A [Thermodesulfobium acidiphilum]|uniref:Signal peptide peptidase A n=1 Tax=Thermodesulfobium acidiphilum TaxID=1794699 RepID=A0A2R4W2V5_THEAF|nr:signal peptide peptidase SppA [Thermodesulfobium acidiphilum]AWB11070.1 signal peptide peptidase A [Thermodesulfobium acidiphilum]PMP86385.1 MAG: signal peptide peptidase SppA [Thermodesulfobium narugense]